MNELGEVRDGGTQTVQEGRLFFLEEPLGYRCLNIQRDEVPIQNGIKSSSRTFVQTPLPDYLAWGFLLFQEAHCFERMLAVSLFLRMPTPFRFSKKAARVKRQAYRFHNSG